MSAKAAKKVEVKDQRAQLVQHLHKLTDKLMIGLAFVWLGLMIGDFIKGLSRPLQIANYIIWAIFIIDFLIKFWISPHKLHFLRKHWITVISLVLPAFRLVRIFQALNALRALSLLRILTTMNRGMGALAEAMGRRGIGYIIVVTIIVLFGGAAGMYAFEKPDVLIKEGFKAVADQGGGLHSYSDSIWWTAMLMTTIGSQYWPVTNAGRVLCFLISMFSLGVFGYITATLAGFFVDSDDKEDKKKEAKKSELEGLRADINALRSELAKHKLKP